MKKTKRLTAGLIILIMALSLFTACDGDGIGGGKSDYKITAGGWDGDTFTNEWSNITFTLPETMRKLGNRELLDISLMVQGASSNHEGFAGTQRDISDGSAFVDFAVVEREVQESFIMVYYVGGNKDETAQDIIDEVVSENMEYIRANFGVIPKRASDTTTRIAGETFQKGGYYIEFEDEGSDEVFTLFTDYLVRKQGDIFIIFVVEYDDIDKDDIMDVLDSIKAVK